MKYSILIVVCAFFGFACVEEIPEPETYAYTFWQVKRIDVSDGIDEEEADIIAHAFFYSGISGCGYAKKPTLVGDEWVAQTLEGYAAHLGKPIRVNKDTGNVVWDGDGKLVTLKEIQAIEYNK